MLTDGTNLIFHLSAAVRAGRIPTMPLGQVNLRNKQVVQSIHNKGMKVIIDWIPSHRKADNRWLTEQPDFFVKRQHR